ncbi:transcription initiation factor IIF subunit alpha-like [Zingiber officinale]|uniref:transcription initiation factor IIF subunit alpha-like n=1 Tax=Zingiber officinale TaxID=94328 RepID=UPI001C4D52AD|nr:transcription initiation factor IIF subunit alpha-like [Zingiber officinale]
MSLDWVLRPCCDRCHSTSDLYGSNCKHMTLCLECGKGMAANRGRCRLCGALITKLIQEYNVQPMANTDEDFHIGRFPSGLPPFSKNSAENRWSLDTEGLQERQLTDIVENENKPWILEDETGHHQYQGQVEGPQSSTATRYLLKVHGRDCFAFAVPDGSRYNFRKIAQGKQLTLEEAEEIMNKRRHNATGHGRWMMKTTTSGAASFREVKKNEGISKAEADEGSQVKKWKSNDEGDHSDKGDEDEEEWETRKNRFARNKLGVDDDEGDHSDKGDEDEEEWETRKNRFAGNKLGVDDDEGHHSDKGDEDEKEWETRKNRFTRDKLGVDNDEEGGKGGDFNLDDDDDIEKGDDWEHEQTFTDDDEAVGIDPGEREELDPIPTPPEIKQDEEDEDEENCTLSKSGKEMKQLLIKAAILNEFKGEEEEEDEDDDKDAPKDEPAETSPTNAAQPSGSGCSTPAESKAKSEHSSDDENRNDSLPVKTENTIVKAEAVMNSYKPSVSTKPPSTEAVTEEDIRAAVIVAAEPVKLRDLAAKFKPRVKTSEERHAFAEILKRISKLRKVNGHIYIVLRDK